MKNKSFLRLFKFFTQRIPGRHPNNAFDFVRLRAARTKVELKNILRWEDDGRPVKDKGVDPSIILDSYPYDFKATYNPTRPVKSNDPYGWVSPWHYGLNQGPIIL